jgi:hypothetical protein
VLRIVRFPWSACVQLAINDNAEIREPEAERRGCPRRIEDAIIAVNRPRMCKRPWVIAIPGGRERDSDDVPEIGPCRDQQRDVLMAPTRRQGRHIARERRWGKEAPARKQ